MQVPIFSTSSDASPALESQVPAAPGTPPTAGFSAAAPPPIPDTAPSGVSTDSPMDKLTAWLKSPAVLAGGAVVAGVLVARLAGRDVLRQWVGSVVADHLKKRQTAAAAPAAVAAEPPAAAPPPGGVLGSALLGALTAQALPVLVDAAKKLLAQTAAKKH